MDETEYTKVHHSKQKAYCPSNTTTVLYFGTATCFIAFDHHRAISKLLQVRLKMHVKYTHSVGSNKFTKNVTI